MTNDAITLRQLVESLDGGLVPVAPAKAPAVAVDAVHISELLDPTPFLYGRELLLTTGLSVPLTGSGARAYVQRLRVRGIVGLGVGLGPVLAEVPAVLQRACTRQNLPLLVVPVEATFQNVTRTFWSLHGAAHERLLHAALDSHRRLATAATSPEPVPAVLRVLADSIDGDVVLTDANGQVIQALPESHSPTTEFTAALHRLRAMGHRSAATLPVGDRLGSFHPIVADASLAGYLCTVSATPLAPHNRGLLLAALAMLGLDAHHRSRGASLGVAVRSAVANLVDRGQLSAIRPVAEATGVDAPPARVRLAVLRYAPGQGASALSALTAALPDAGWWAVAGERTTWLIAHPGLVSLDDGLLSRVVAATGPSAAAVIGPLGDLADVPAMRRRLEAQALGLAPGQVRGYDHDDGLPFVTGDWAAGVLAPLRSRPAVLTAVAAYLRHQGSWERAAREVGIHRNSLRARIGQAEALLDGELSDPDVAARVWIALRATALDQ